MAAAQALAVAAANFVAQAARIANAVGAAPQLGAGPHHHIIVMEDRVVSCAGWLDADATISRRYPGDEPCFTIACHQLEHANQQYDLDRLFDPVALAAASVAGGRLQGLPPMPPGLRWEYKRAPLLPGGVLQNGGQFTLRSTPVGVVPAEGAQSKVLWFALQLLCHMKGALVSGSPNTGFSIIKSDVIRKIVEHWDAADWTADARALGVLAGGNMNLTPAMVAARAATFGDNGGIGGCMCGGCVNGVLGNCNGHIVAGGSVNWINGRSDDVNVRAVQRPCAKVNRYRGGWHPDEQDYTAKLVAAFVTGAAAGVGERDFRVYIIGMMQGDGTSETERADRFDVAWRARIAQDNLSYNDAIVAFCRNRPHWFGTVALAAALGNTITAYPKEVNFRGAATNVLAEPTVLGCFTWKRAEFQVLGNSYDASVQAAALAGVPFVHTLSRAGDHQAIKTYHHPNNLVPWCVCGFFAGVAGVPECVC